MNPKVAIVILVVIVVVFIVAVSTNLFPKSKFNKDGPPPNWVQAMQKGLVYYRPLDLKDVSAPPGCIAPPDLVIAPGGTCTYNIKSSGIPARRLLVMVGPVNVTISIPNKKPSSQNVSPGDKFDVMSGGGKLVVACLSLAQCDLHPSSAA